MEIVSAQVFVDWDSARRIVRPPWPAESRIVSVKDRKSHVLNSFSELQARVAQALERLSPKRPIRVGLSRIYHGWHRGVTATDDRRAWEEAVGELRPLRTKSVSYLPDIAFGDRLLCGGDRVPLRDTLRTRDDGVDQQKMVDTALVSDLLSYCRAESAAFRRGEEPKSMALVIADDDDVLPGSFVAERWGLPVKVLRVNRNSESRFLNLRDLVYSI